MSEFNTITGSVYLLPSAVDAQAEAAPDRPAMRFLDESLSYEELASRSNQLARSLAELGVRRRDTVGIYMDKCIHTPVALHGIMKAGAAYVPLDPSAPAERVAAVIADCGIRHVVSMPDKLKRIEALPELGRPEWVVGPSADGAGSVRCVSWSDVAAAPTEPPAKLKLIGDDLAYVIYTSGSTGRPKGIMHTHASGLSFSRWAAREYGLGTGDVLSNHAPLHFDLSILDFFAGAVAGCSTSIIPEEYTRLPASYSKLIADHRITVLYTVPFAMIQLLLRGVIEQRDLSALRWAIFGGEPFPVKHLKALMDQLPHVAFDNIYGPAEVNGITHCVVPRLDGKETTVPIGPIADHAEALIVDETDAPLARGEIGELLVRSPTMMKGYWDRPELNAKAFYRRTLVPGHDEVFYRTGDLVVEQPDGAMVFVGRKDRQVKVRGYRVELDEVEAALGAHDEVEEAAAVTLPAGDGSRRIVAAVTLRAGGSAEARTLLAHAKRRLPWYAVPSEIAVRADFPRTPTGKTDRRALAELLAGPSAARDDADPEAPPGPVADADAARTARSSQP